MLLPQPVVRSAALPQLAAARATIPLMALQPSTPPRAVPLAALAFYFSYFFLSDFPPGPNVFATGPEFFSTVIDLSLNFFFILPITQPALAPSCDPMYEAIFNIAIAFSLLFVGFATDGRKSRSHTGLLQNAFLPFLAAMPFATNLAYLSYLGLRPETDESSDSAPRAQQQPAKAASNPLEELGEARWLPVVIVGVVIFSLGWGLFARPEYGPLSERLTLLTSLLSSERLAYALTGDILFFALFQSWMLEADLERRMPAEEMERQTLLTIGRAVPFFGKPYTVDAKLGTSNPRLACRAAPLSVSSADATGSTAVC